MLRLKNDIFNTNQFGIIDRVNIEVDCFGDDIDYFVDTILLFYPGGKITKNAIKISEVMKQKFDLDLFPYIITTQNNSESRAAGGTKFSMFERVTGTEYSFDLRQDKYLKKVRNIQFITQVQDYPQ